ncbi:hypothetical protein BDV09DRAFT_106383 [Aspergillus tetrazonus]
MSISLPYVCFLVLVRCLHQISKLFPYCASRIVLGRKHSRECIYWLSCLLRRWYKQLGYESKCLEKNCHTRIKEVLSGFW